MKPVESLRELQLIELDILKFFADICERNNLQYFLAFGTLLGAVRHQGFIPWDDDIDVMMPRPDYDKFIKIMDNEKGRYRLLRVKNDNDYSLVFAKVIDTNTVIYENVCDTIKKELSVYIDIFPLDALGNDAEKASRIISYENRKCGRIAHSAASNANLSTVRMCTHFVWKHYYSIKGREICLEKEFDKLRANNFDSSKYIGLLSGFIFMNYVLERKDFASADELTFEGHVFKAPIGYHEHLTQLYGDYMELPPEEERVGKHNIEVYIKE